MAHLSSPFWLVSSCSFWSCGWSDRSSLRLLVCSLGLQNLRGFNATVAPHLFSCIYCCWTVLDHCILCGYI
jgi:hypothetical protein